MLDFKLNYYFEKYKDICILSVPRFREMFIKENGDFPLISELAMMIQKYQYKEYGNLLSSGRRTGVIVEKGTYNKKENARMRDRFGTKEERQRRALIEKWRNK